MSEGNILTPILDRFEADILDEWVEAQKRAASLRADLLSADDLRAQSAEMLALFAAACRSGNIDDITTEEWAPVRSFLQGLSRNRALQGFTPTETAMFVFSLKEPLFSRLTQATGADAGAAASAIWTVTTLIDKLGLVTTEAFIQNREEMIRRQQIEMLELSTPVVKIWPGILALPLIGTLDSSRTQVVMESLLKAIVETGSSIAIIDITGVPTVDTLVAQHLLRTVAAARLMGSSCIISGIRPQIAQTMVHLGVTFTDVVTKASLSDALAFAFKQSGLVVSRQQKQQ
ncbi:MAG: STAS domain-containing protein [Vicinamibacterales bacterium]